MAKQDKKTGLYKTEHTDDDLYRLVGLTAPVARPGNPEKMTMVGFDGHSAAIAKKEKLPTPPTARAIQMRFVKPWREIVAAAIAAIAAGTVEQAVGATKKADEWSDLDEAHIYYAMHRVAAFLKLESLSELGYDAGRSDLIESVSRAEAALLEQILPRSWQIKRVANDDWELALALVGMKPERRQFEAHPMLNLIWHYYETKDQYPSENKLRAYVNGELELAMPRGRDRPFSDYLDELKAARAERGWSTPEDGPPAGECLSEAELAALIEGRRVGKYAAAGQRRRSRRRSSPMSVSTSGRSTYACGTTRGPAAGTAGRRTRRTASTELSGSGSSGRRRSWLPRMGRRRRRRLRPVPK
jgi:hypothetical protein